MAMAIRAVVNGSTDGRVRRQLAYLVGTVVGGTTLGVSVGLAGYAAGGLGGDQAQRWLPSVAVVVAAAAALSPEHHLWPERRNQIPRWWVHLPSWYGLMLSGIVLGTGVFNYVKHAVFHVLVALIFVGGAVAPWASVALGATYGLVLGLAPLAQSGRAIRTIEENKIPEQLKRWLGRPVPFATACVGVALLALPGIQG